MMEKLFSSFLGSGLVVLTAAGFAEKEQPKHLFGLMNVDTHHSILRIPLTLALLYAGSKQAPLKNTRAVLTLVGVFYVTIGSVGCIDKKVGGILPSKLTNFDLMYHFTVGTSALWLGSRSGRMMK
ncbi:MAG: hypothetical protein JWN38_475 [Candidatus Saccharibacteria bacterium]|nr:hypothetical protein [Candidatus Saccharibacteria bacterium]